MLPVIFCHDQFIMIVTDGWFTNLLCCPIDSWSKGPVYLLPEEMSLLLPSSIEKFDSSASNLDPAKQVICDVISFVPCS